MIVLDTNVVAEAMKPAPWPTVRAWLAVLATPSGRGFPTPDGYIAAIAASRGFIVASRDTAPYAAAGVTAINPWKA